MSEKLYKREVDQGLTMGFDIFDLFLFETNFTIDNHARVKNTTFDLAMIDIAVDAG
ncbi:unnamed protein product [Fusarium graminearum]|uniref:Chromosome 4, complete genome n=1 Tax=Gibberella zeae (strain ATCC MYA-4620 / CBS 123657 / FGSC 9075 / NRRL 31084 / PH-1) TaxID=229533 RepID=A0A098DU37_GIBZE|nr:unnamed protein product [Fusarium graminearum]CZS72721.1 unnamed protein product [Fusarium graminearum]